MTDQAPAAPAASLPAPSNPLLAFVRLLIFFSWTFAAALWIVIANIWTRSDRGRDALAGRWIHRWAKFGRRLTGIRLTVTGTPPKGGTFIAANHVGYVDVFAMASAIPCYFAPRADSANWPVLGPIVRLVRLPLIERTRGSRTIAKASGQLSRMLGAGHNVCIFLEGTSTGGDRVLPFRPGLVQTAIDQGAPLVPAAIVWSAANPKIEVAEHVAYWKDEHSFGPHAWKFFGLRGVEVEVRFGEPIPAEGAESRKALAEEAHKRVLELMGLEQPAK